MLKNLSNEKYVLSLPAIIPAMPLNDAHFGRFSIFCAAHHGRVWNRRLHKEIGFPQKWQMEQFWQ